MTHKAVSLEEFAIVTLGFDPDGTQVHVESASTIGLSHAFGSAHFPDTDSAIEQITVRAKPLKVRFRLPGCNKEH